MNRSAAMKATSFANKLSVASLSASQAKGGMDARKRRLHLCIVDAAHVVNHPLASSPSPSARGALWLMVKKVAAR